MRYQHPDRAPQGIRRLPQFQQNSPGEELARLAAQEKKKKERRIIVLTIILVLILVASVLGILYQLNQPFRSFVRANILGEPKVTVRSLQHETVAPPPPTTLAPVTTTTAAPTESPEEKAAREKREDEANTVNIVVSGDMLFHTPILYEGLAQKPEVGNFDFLFKYSKPILEKADLAICDMEGTLAANDDTWTGYPTFKAPDTAADAIKAAGVDIVYTANNHSLDNGLEGLIRTAQVFKEKGIDVVGTRAKADDPKYLLKEVKGLRFAFSSWTYETDRQGANNEHLSFNGIPLPIEGEPLIDSFSIQVAQPIFMEQSEKALRERVAMMKQANPDVIIFFMHWGDEYSAQPNEVQKHYAQILADAGVDIVVGCHPHVVEPVQMVSSTDGKHQMLCYWSLGNFFSNQQNDSGNSNGRAEDGMLATLSFVRSAADHAVRLTKAGYIPLYMVKSYPNYPTENRMLGWPVPVREALAKPADFGCENIVDKLKASLERTESVVGAKLDLPLPLVLRPGDPNLQGANGSTAPGAPNPSSSESGATTGSTEPQAGESNQPGASGPSESAGNSEPSSSGAYR